MTVPDSATVANLPGATPPPRRRLRASWGMLVWLTLVWVLLWGDFTLANLVNGLIVGLVVTTVLPLPAIPFNGRFRPWGVVLLITRFLRDVVVASGEVAWLAVRGRKPRGAVIRVRLRSHSDFYLTMTAGFTSLVPGSIVVEAHRLTGTLYIHIINVETKDGLEKAHRAVLAQEERILRAFASREELLDAGLMPGSSPRAGKCSTLAGDIAQAQVDARRDDGSGGGAGTSPVHDAQDVREEER
ncbi:Na+/H+ antiporter subunit E [Georgenia wangjunii]|uniref:Na+/H+ antiporter subunit E n=1 Tax=Georgenia wangjunii TaxID=3117730 RepID=UPI002F267BED